MPKFADDVKLYRAIVDSHDYAELSVALESVSCWSANWQLPLASGKCCVFHIGHSNELLDYELAGSSLNHTLHTRDLGVWFNHNLKWATHCCHVVKVARQRAAIVRRCFVSGDRNTLFWAFCVFVRPILEYASPVWSPYLVADIDHVESVQRVFTKRLPGFSHMSYTDRLRALGGRFAGTTSA